MTMRMALPAPTMQTWLARLLFGIGIGCLAFVVYALVDARWFAWVEGRRFERALGERRAASSKQAPGGPRGDAAQLSSRFPPAFQTDRIDTFRASPPGPAAEEGAVLGRIEIPRLGVSALLLEGVEPETLRHGAGHIPETALPAQHGNVGVAAHRDSYFRRLQDVAPGDTVRLTTLEGTFDYRVDWTRVVEQEQVDVLAPGAQSELTLVTCYPFSYVGPAPQRFIVRAHLG
jgi:LPXTG-site transpeptidase (sortase) family protein